MGTVAEGLAWQIGVWDQMAPVYIREIDKRFVPVVEHLIGRAELKPGQHVLDLGTGTGSVALRVAPAITPDGHVTAVDISPEMLELARQRTARAARTDISFEEGRAEMLPVQAESIDVVLACLSLIYVIDRAAAAREIARVLRPGAQLAAAVWAGPQTRGHRAAAADGRQLRAGAACARCRPGRARRPCAPPGPAVGGGGGGARRDRDH